MHSPAYFKAGKAFYCCTQSGSQSHSEWSKYTGRDEFGPTWSLPIDSGDERELLEQALVTGRFTLQRDDFPFEEISAQDVGR